MEEKLSSIREVCSKRHTERSSSDLKILIDFTKDMKIFKEACQEMCCQYLYYESFLKDSYVFRAGNDSDKFYIIISGRVSIEVLGANLQIKPVCELKEGDYFGELGLQNNQPRAASARCAVNTHFFYLLKNDYLAVLDKSLSKKRNALAVFLREIPAFRFLSYAGLKKFTYNTKEISMYKSNVLYNEGDNDRNVYIVREGEFSLFKTLQIPKRIGLQKRVKNCFKKVLILGTGEVFGEFEAHMKKSRDFTCVCTSAQGSILAIDINEFCQRINKEEVIQLINAQSKKKHQQMLRRFSLWASLEEDSYHKHMNMSSESIRHIKSSSGLLKVHKVSYSKPGIIHDLSNPTLSTEKKMILSRSKQFSTKLLVKNSLDGPKLEKRYTRVKLKKLKL